MSIHKEMSACVVKQRAHEGFPFAPNPSSLQNLSTNSTKNVLTYCRVGPGSESRRSGRISRTTELVDDINFVFDDENMTRTRASYKSDYYYDQLIWTDHQYART
jgi:hypothetical protein